MTTISLSDIQKNIGTLSNLKKPLKIRDKRKNIDVAVVYPVSNSTKKSILDIGGTMKPNKKILEKSKNMSFDKIRKEAVNIHLEDRIKTLGTKK